MNNSKIQIVFNAILQRKVKLLSLSKEGLYTCGNSSNGITAITLIINKIPQRIEIVFHYALKPLFYRNTFIGTEKPTHWDWNKLHFKIQRFVYHSADVKCYLNMPITLLCFMSTVWIRYLSHQQLIHSVIKY